jgi:hypothetical protein
VEGSTAMKFENKAEVLDFGPRRPKGHGKYSSLQYLLWPALAYRVIAPKVTERESDLFQTAILGLWRAGVRDINEIGEKLSIHREMVLHIIVRLCEEGLMDLEFNLTEKALSQLDGEETKNSEMVSGFVFQDPWNQRLWPRFRKDFQFCDCQPKGRGGFEITLESSTKGAPQIEWAPMVLPDGAGSPSSPRPEEIVKAVASASREGKSIEGDFSPDEINKVEYFDEVPTPVFLKTSIYFVPSTKLKWYVCDPFGHGDSPYLHGRINLIAKDHKKLNDLLKKFEGRFEERVFNDEKQAWGKFKAVLAQKAKKEVIRRMTPEISKIGEVQKYLVDMETVWLEQSQSPSFSVPGISPVFINCRKALEALFEHWATDHVLEGLHQQFFVEKVEQSSRKRKPLSNKELIKARYKRAFRACGFDSNVPVQFMGRTPGHLKSVCEYKSYSSLDSVVVVTSLAAEVDESHPFRAAARRNPLLLDNISDLVGKAGKIGAHAVPENVTVTLQTAEAIKELTYKVLLDMTGFNPDEEKSANEKN